MLAFLPTFLPTFQLALFDSFPTDLLRVGLQFLVPLQLLLEVARPPREERTQRLDRAQAHDVVHHAAQPGVSIAIIGRVDVCDVEAVLHRVVSLAVVPLAVLAVLVAIAVFLPALLHVHPLEPAHRLGTAYRVAVGDKDDVDLGELPVLAAFWEALHQERAGVELGALERRARGVVLELEVEQIAAGVFAEHVELGRVAQVDGEELLGLGGIQLETRHVERRRENLRRQVRPPVEELLHVEIVHQGELVCRAVRHAHLPSRPAVPDGREA